MLETCVFPCVNITFYVGYYLHLYSVQCTDYKQTIFQHECQKYFSLVSLNWNVVESKKRRHRILFIFNSPMNINIVIKISSNANRNVEHFDHDIDE